FTNVVTNATTTNVTIRTAVLTSANLVRALAADLGMDQGSLAANTNLVGGRLIRKVDLNSGNENIVIRKGTNEVDVTGFFTTVANNFNTSSEVTETQTKTTGTTTNHVNGLHSVGLNT